jgi:hypothetical protein
MRGSYLAAAVFATMLGVAGAPQARAAYVIDVGQDGDNVVATGSGTLDFTDIFHNTNYEISPFSPGVTPSVGYLGVGYQYNTCDCQHETFAYVYEGLSGPTSFGSGGFTAASSTSGATVGIVGSNGGLILPYSYSPGGSLLPSTTTWDHATIAGLGLKDGTYVWTWGSGADADSFTVDVSGAPEASTWAMMALGFAALGFAGYRASRKSAALSH